MVNPIQREIIPYTCRCFISKILLVSMVPESIDNIIKSNPVATKASNPKQNNNAPEIEVAKMINGRSNNFKRNAPVIASIPKTNGLSQTKVFGRIKDNELNKTRPKLIPPSAPNPIKIQRQRNPESKAPITPKDNIPIPITLSKLFPKLK